MSLSKGQLTRLYVRRLVNTQFKSFVGDEYLDIFSNEISDFLLSGAASDRVNPDDIVDHFKKWFLLKGKRNDWIRFNSLLNSLSNLKSPEKILNYLEFLKELGEGTGDSIIDTEKEMMSIENEAEGNGNTVIFSNALNSAPDIENKATENKRRRFTQARISQEQLISAYYQTIDEPQIIEYLSFTLLGMDSKNFTFSEIGNSIELSKNINNSYSRVLRDILEAGLLYKKLQLFYSSNNGVSVSPIKTSFLRCLEVELSAYVDFINVLFNNKPKTLLEISSILNPSVLKLRLISSLVNKFNLVGYELLSLVHLMSQFGDTRVIEVCKRFSTQILKPYYELLEHWVIRGELADNNDEFFVRFNPQKNFFNDIIEFLPERLPEFGIINKDIAYKIFQIGKMLIFLSKYCKELKWLNSYDTKYSRFIFQFSGGLRSMTVSQFVDLIEIQYSETLNYFTYVVHTKYQILSHIVNYKHVLLMKSADFIDSVINYGKETLNEPSSMLTGNSLSDILSRSIGASSVGSLGPYFSKRIDARVLNLGHGNMGWEVFTLEYKIMDLPIYQILNHNNRDIEYLKLFNFLWKLRHFYCLLDVSMKDSFTIQKNELRKLKSRFSRQRSYSGEKMMIDGIRESQVLWLIKSFRLIDIFRFGLSKLISILIRYLSHDIIEASFSRNIVEKLINSKGFFRDNKSELLLPFNSKFASELIQSNAVNDVLSFKKMDIQTKELTFDELIAIHDLYLNEITGCKILRDDSIGKKSGVSFISQIYNFLDICSVYIKSSDEFFGLTSSFVSLLNIEENSNVTDYNSSEDNLDVMESNMRSLISKLYHNLYLSQFKVAYDMFTNDLRRDLELKDLGKAL